MEQAKIRASAHIVPDHVVTNDDLSALMATDDEWIYSRTGIHQRHVVSDQDTSDLATAVARQLLTKAACAATELDFIIVCTMSPDRLSPNTAALVQAAIGATNAFAFDLSAACSGFVYGLATATALLTSRYQRGIVIGAEVLSKLVDWHDRTTAVLFGDGAAGVLVERTDQPVGLLVDELRTFGDVSGDLVAGKFGNQSPFAADLTATDQFFHQNGREVYGFATREVPAALATALERAALSADDIDYYILHQANARIVSSIAKRFGQPLSKFPTNMANFGNTSAASIGILFDELRANGTITAGQKVAFAGFGGGLTVGVQIWQL